MTDLIVFEKDGQYLADSREVCKYLGIEFDGELYLNYIDLYELVCRVSVFRDDCISSKLFRILELAEEMTPSSIFSTSFMSTAISSFVIGNLQAQELKEFDIHKIFQDNIRKTRPEIEIIHKKSNLKHIPDFWVKWEEKECPVEIKLHNFTNQSLNQLQRYMNFYKSEKGIAVAKECDILLPDNILFISTDELRAKMP